MYCTIANFWILKQKNLIILDNSEKKNLNYIKFEKIEKNFTTIMLNLYKTL